MATCYIGLGTNIGDKEENLKSARQLIDKIEFTKILKKSSIKKTDPVDYLDQPKFLNQIIQIDTSLTPTELLNRLQEIEKSIGRKKIINKGPRIIDLDILLYDNHIISDKRLNIPHKEIKNRDFILEHLIELNKDLMDPISKMKYREILKDVYNK